MVKNKPKKPVIPQCYVIFLMGVSASQVFNIIKPENFSKIN